jgi:archaellum component FlaC
MEPDPDNDVTRLKADLFTAKIVIQEQKDKIKRLQRQVQKLNHSVQVLLKHIYNNK